MNFELSKEQSLLQAMARDFAEKRLEPIARQIDEENQIPAEILAEMGELELFGIPIGEEYGGAAGGYDGYVLVMEQIARISGGVAMTLAAHTLGLGALDKFGTEEQKQKYLPDACKGKTIASFAFTEPGTGSDPKQLTSTAVKEGDYYILNGTKRFISNANHPGPCVIFARESESQEVTAFIVDKWCEGYSISEPWAKIGMKGGVLTDVYMENIKVPAQNLLGQIGQGFPILLYGIALGKIGTSRESIASFMQLLYSWAMGSSRPASSFPFSVNRILTLRRSEGSSIRSTSPCLLKRSTRSVTAGLSSCTRPAISLIPAPSCSNKSNRTKDWPRVIPNSKKRVLYSRLIFRVIAPNLKHQNC
jgi:alkylation response protein AidB-like acyl-CoA dehydrogenase